MPQHDERIDRYIAAAAPFAQPILNHLRAQVHAACPGVVETIEWGMPFFEHYGVLCHMAAFKAHCGFGFWKHRLTADKAPPPTGDAMGEFGRITQLADLPSDAELQALIAKAAAMNQAGGKPKAAVPRVAKPALAMPPTFAAALAGHAAAAAQFQAFTPGKQREYLEWIIEAKTDATRDKRIAQAIDWLADGKARHWKYEAR